jgi:hypothetical protein
MDVVKRVREAVARMNTDGTLPRGVRIEPFYDRGDLVAVTVRTVLNNMLFGVVLIFLIQWMFLGDLRSALIVSATIPVALQAANIDVRIEPEPETTGTSARQAPEVKPDTKKAKAQTAQSKNRARTVRRPRPTEPMAYAQQPFFGGYRPMY